MIVKSNHAHIYSTEKVYVILIVTNDKYVYHSIKKTECVNPEDEVAELALTECLIYLKKNNIKNTSIYTNNLSVFKKYGGKIKLNLNNEFASLSIHLKGKDQNLAYYFNVQLVILNVDPNTAWDNVVARFEKKSKKGKKKTALVIQTVKEIKYSYPNDHVLTKGNSSGIVEAINTLAVLNRDIKSKSIKEKKSFYRLKSDFVNKLISSGIGSVIGVQDIQGQTDTRKYTVFKVRSKLFHFPATLYDVDNLPTLKPMKVGDFNRSRIDDSQDASEMKTTLYSYMETAL